MDYSAIIQNRKSVRGFSDKEISSATVSEIKSYYQNKCKRLIPSLKTELFIFGSDSRKDLEGSAGYENFLIGAPQYLVLLSEEDEHAEENGGFMMEDMILKLTEMNLDTCWITFADANKVKDVLYIESPMKIVAIAAFGYGKKMKKGLRFNPLTMFKVDEKAKRHYFDPKLSIHDIVYMNEWENYEGLHEFIGFYEDMLWESLYAATLTPSYLNRQPYRFVLKGHQVILVQKPDEYTDEVSAQLGLGIVMLHFASVASQWSAKVDWKLDETVEGLELPEGHRVAAVCTL